MSIISRDGASGLTMERVAAEAGVAKGTLYVYYKNKKELLESVKEASMRPMREELFAILDGSLPPGQKVRCFIERHLGYLDANRDFFRVLLWDRQIAEEHLRRHRSERYQSYVDRISRVLREGMRLDLFRTLDPVKVAAMLIEADMAMIAQRLSIEAPGPVEQDAEFLFDMFTRGISKTEAKAPKPQEDADRAGTTSPPRATGARAALKSHPPHEAPRKDRTR